MTRVCPSMILSVHRGGVSPAGVGGQSSWGGQVSPARGVRSVQLGGGGGSGQSSWGGGVSPARGRGQVSPAGGEGVVQSSRGVRSSWGGQVQPGG